MRRWRPSPTASNSSQPKCPPCAPSRCSAIEIGPEPVAPEAVGDYVHRELPNASLVQLRATGHCPNLSAPDETAAAIEAFVRS